MRDYEIYEGYEYFTGTSKPIAVVSVPDTELPDRYIYEYVRKHFPDYTERFIYAVSVKHIEQNGTVFTQRKYEFVIDTYKMHESAKVLYDVAYKLPYVDHLQYYRAIKPKQLPKVIKSCVTLGYTIERLTVSKT